MYGYVILEFHFNLIKVKWLIKSNITAIRLYSSLSWKLNCVKDKNSFKLMRYLMIFLLFFLYLFYFLICYKPVIYLSRTVMTTAPTQHQKNSVITIPKNTKQKYMKSLVQSNIDLKSKSQTRRLFVWFFSFSFFLFFSFFFSSFLILFLFFQFSFSFHSFLSFFLCVFFSNFAHTKIPNVYFTYRESILFLFLFSS